MSAASNPLYTLPNDAQEIIERLTAVNDDPRVVTDLYPRIAQAAGRTLLPSGLRLVVTLALYDYIEAGNYPSAYYTALAVYVPDWMAALARDAEERAHD